VCKQHPSNELSANEACSSLSNATIAMPRLTPFLVRMIAHFETSPNRLHRFERRDSSKLRGKFLMQIFRMNKKNTLLNVQLHIRVGRWKILLKYKKEFDIILASISLLAVALVAINVHG
jgi:hypothetical protein